MSRRDVVITAVTRSRVTKAGDMTRRQVARPVNVIFARSSIPAQAQLQGCMAGGSEAFDGRRHGLLHQPVDRGTGGGDETTHASFEVIY